MKLFEMPRVRLATLPTPLEEMKNLTDYLGGPRLWIKRDDMTGLAFGGNKVRKLEFIIADALSKKATVLISSGGVQTNWGRLMVAAAVRFGIKPVLVLTGEEPASYRGNLCLDYLMGAELHFVSVKEGLDPQKKTKALREAGEAKVSELQEYYFRKGDSPYVVPRGGRTSHGTAGYLSATLEIGHQLFEMGLSADYIVTGVGSTSTMGSLLLASKVFHTGIKVLGISVSRPKEECCSRVLEQIEKDAVFYGFDVSADFHDIEIFDDWIGPGYAVPSKEGMEAIKLVAEKEATILDHVYSGKAMAGLIGLIRKGFFRKRQTVIFLHTGGAPGLFALDDKDFRAS